MQRFALALLLAACTAPPAATPAVTTPDARAPDAGMPDATLRDARDHDAPRAEPDVSAGCGEAERSAGVCLTARDREVLATLSPLPPPPRDPTNAYEERDDAALLGQRLFFDARLSGPLVAPENAALGDGGNGPVGVSGRVSCARCHTPEHGFSDARTFPPQTSLGAGFTPRHSPSLLNVAHQRWFFWDGRKDALWSQVLGPLESPLEHNFSRVAVVRVLARHHRAEYEAIFGPLPDLSDPARFPDTDRDPTTGRPGEAHPDALDYDEMSPADQALVDRAFVDAGKALAAYLRRLESRDSRFDRFVAGEASALDSQERHGLALFLGRAGCIRCHEGPALSDRAFHNDGVAQDGLHVARTDVGRAGGIPAVLADPLGAAGVYSDDPAAGRVRLAGLAVQARDLGAFKTPGLRGVAASPPYFHTGYAPTLEDVVRAYDKGGGDPSVVSFAGDKDERLAPLHLTEAEISALAAFLRTLEGAPLDPRLLGAP